MGGATIADHLGFPTGVISIHAPRGGSDAAVPCLFPHLEYFNPRSPWGERHLCISSRSTPPPFQSTLPVGGATRNTIATPRLLSIISIHAPRGGSDAFRLHCRKSNCNFNPRSPWGERPISAGSLTACPLFQSTLPVGGATLPFRAYSLIWNISIHAPRGGSDLGAYWGLRQLPISIHAPRGGSDLNIGFVQSHKTNFNPRSPWGERQQRCTVLGAHLWRRYIIFAHFREIGLSAWAASGESGGKQRSKSRANLPGIFCLPGLRNQRIRGASGI